MTTQGSAPILYIKTGCGWCHDALAFFKKYHIEVDVRNVSESQADMARMVEISGQTLTPTLEYGDFMVADFGLDELEAALRKRQDVAQQWGVAI